MTQSSAVPTQTCAGCGALIDVSGEDPFSLKHCPTCGLGMRVRCQFNHFTIQEALGSGGMGTVFRALDTNLNRLVALKLLRKEFSANPEFVRQFRAEAAATASVSHPHVVNVYSCGEDHGLLYIAMELVDKGSLDDLMAVNGKVAELQVMEVGIQIARGLNAALKAGLIHRDIKPGNILFANSATAKIVDFGLAALVDDTGKVAGEVWGTPYYVAPEKLDGGREDERSDIYSLGATLFHALAGRPPFEADTASMTALKEIKAQPVSIASFAPEISSATAYVINKTLNCDPALRYSSYEALIESFEYARDEQRKAIANKNNPQAAAAETAPSYQWITLGVAAAVVACGLGLYSKIHGNRTQNLGSGIELSTEVPAVPSSQAFEEALQQARSQLLAGNYGAAAESFRRIDSRENLPQPQKNWITLNEGLAFSLQGHDIAARQSFEKIHERGQFSNRPEELALAGFFLNLAEVLRVQTALPPGAAAPFKGSPYQQFALLLLALKDWNDARFDTSATLFKQCKDAPATGSLPWPLETAERDALQLVVGVYLEDYAKFHALERVLTVASTHESRIEALGLAKTTRAGLKLPGRLVSTLEETIRRLDGELTAGTAEEERKATEREIRTLAEAKQRRATLASQFRFSEALSALSGLKLTSENHKLEQQLLASRTEWLMRFKALLIRDLNTRPCNLPVVRKSGITTQGIIGRADDLQLQVRTQYGFVPVPWADVSYDCALAMAGSFVSPGMPADAVADRKWLIGSFACFAGRTTQGQALLNDAARTKHEYTSLLALFDAPEAP